MVHILALPCGLPEQTIHILDTSRRHTSLSLAQKTVVRSLLRQQNGFNWAASLCDVYTALSCVCWLNLRCSFEARNKRIISQNQTQYTVHRSWGLHVEAKLHCGLAFTGGAARLSSFLFCLHCVEDGLLCHSIHALSVCF